MKNYLYSIILITIFLFIWEAGARFVNTPFILPAPTEIAIKLWELKAELLLHHLPVTLAVIAIGLGISLVLGIILAISMNISKTLEQAIYPILITSQTIPIIALAPIFVLWFGYSIWSKVIVTIIITFFPITVSTFDGFRSTSKELKELFQTLGASKRQLFQAGGSICTAFFLFRVKSSRPHECDWRCNWRVARCTGWPRLF